MGSFAQAYEELELVFNGTHPEPAVIKVNNNKKI